MTKLAINGADGFIRLHLSDGMVCAGYDVRGFVRDNSFNPLVWMGNFEGITLSVLTISFISGQ
jgi:nucleoside-diphosphate-sugar epimerase